MNQFSIAQLAQFSGIKPHTIRIWEQRYGALTPNRSEGNTRYYDNNQLRRLLNLVSLSATGHKIAKLSPLSDKELFKLVEAQKEISQSAVNELFISQILAAGIEYNEALFEKIFSHCILKFGLKDTYLEIIYPSLVRLGLLWSTGNLPPAQEHFLSNLYRQKLLTAIDSLPVAAEKQDSWLLFSREDEFHEMGLLFAHYLLKSAGKKVIYLGTNVPLTSISDCVSVTKVENALFFLVRNENVDEVNDYIDKLQKELRGKRIVVATNEKLAPQLAKRKKTEVIHSVDELLNIL
jgi:MerR family transcriptional regulator, light-induced transcriptional regulator